MYLLYLDESGNPDDPADRHFVLGGAAIFERQTHFLQQALDQIQAKHFPSSPPVEFHASPIRSGRGFWRSVPEATRQAVLGDLVSAVTCAPEQGVVLFAAVVEKSASCWGETAVLAATEQLCRRFDILLMRRFQERHDAQRGLLVFAEGRFHQRSRVWVDGFRRSGTQRGTLKNLADIPYFAATRETRLLQVADLVAHTAFLLYERRDPSLIRGLLPRFDRKDGALHGLVHVTAADRRSCPCPTCHSRRCPGALGPWLDPPAPRAPDT